MINIDNGRLENMKAILGNIKGGVNKALKVGINRTVGTSKNKIAEEITKIYDIAPFIIKKQTEVLKAKEEAGEIKGAISIKGQMIPLIKYRVSPKTPYRGGKRPPPVRVHIKKGGGATIPGAFIQRTKSGYLGVFVRRSDPRKIRQLYGLSVPHMANNPEVAAEINDYLTNKLDDTLETVINAMIKGYIK